MLVRCIDFGSRIAQVKLQYSDTCAHLETSEHMYAEAQADLTHLNDKYKRAKHLLSQRHWRGAGNAIFGFFRSAATCTYSSHLHAQLPARTATCTNSYYLHEQLPPARTATTCTHSYYLVALTLLDRNAAGAHKMRCFQLWKVHACICVGTSTLFTVSLVGCSLAQGNCGIQRARERPCANNHG